jgi:transcriptional regulator with XRE-family HTH domain
MPKDAPPALSLALTMLREAAGWSQKELAAVAGISTGQLSLHEQGKKPLRREVLEAFARPMEFSVELVDLAVLAATILRSPTAGEVPLSPAYPSLAEGRIVNWTAGLMAAAALTLTQEEIRGRLRAHRVTRAEADAERLWRELEACTVAERRLLIERSVEFRSWALGVRLGEESTRAAAKSGAAALELAHLAVRSAELTEGEKRWRSRLAGRARGFVANALRVQGHLREAENELAAAWQLWEAGAAGDPDHVLPEWRLPDLEASLRRDLRMFPAAMELHARACAAAPQEDAGRVLLNLARTLEETGNIEGSVRILQQAAPQIRGSSDQRLHWALEFNLAVNLCHLRRFDETVARLPGLRRLAAALGNGLDETRVQWLSARLAGETGRKDEARAAFERVRDDFAAKRKSLDMVLVSLELTVLHLEDGRLGEVRQVAEAMTWVFAAKSIEREALAALRLFHEAARQERATLQEARAVLAMMNRTARRGF